MSEKLPPTAQRVQGILTSLGLTSQVIELTDSTRTAAEAAQAVGCEVAQIAKSLVFRAKNSGQPVLVIASGANRVNEKRVASLLGEPIERADADFVRQATGFAIGGIPPVGHATAITTLLDEDLWQYAELWAAGGTPHTVFPLTPDDLLKITGGQKAGIK